MRNKQKFTLIAVGFAVFAILIGSLFGKIDSLQASRKLTSNDYHVGAVSVESGKVVESKQNFYSDMFELEEAEIKVEEDCTASYRLFFYNEDKAFIEATDVLTQDFDSASTPEGAKYFRVMVTPGLVDGEPVECKFTNINKYISQISVTIDK